VLSSASRLLTFVVPLLLRREFAHRVPRAAAQPVLVTRNTATK
jgi:hypothetical protein